MLYGRSETFETPGEFESSHAPLVRENILHKCHHEGNGYASGVETRLPKHRFGY